MVAAALYKPQCLMPYLDYIHNWDYMDGSRTATLERCLSTYVYMYIHTVHIYIILYILYMYT